MNRSVLVPGAGPGPLLIVFAERPSKLMGQPSPFTLVSLARRAEYSGRKPGWEVNTLRGAGYVRAVVDDFGTLVQVEA